MFKLQSTAALMALAAASVLLLPTPAAATGLGAYGRWTCLGQAMCRIAFSVDAGGACVTKRENWMRIVRTTYGRPGWCEGSFPTPIIVSIDPFTRDLVVRAARSTFAGATQDLPRLSTVAFRPGADALGPSIHAPDPVTPRLHEEASSEASDADSTEIALMAWRLVGYSLPTKYD